LGSYNSSLKLLLVKLEVTNYCTTNINTHEIIEYI
jgi:hypothetical protein